MELAKITIDPTLLAYVAQALGRVPESLYDLQKIKSLSCGGRPVYQKVTDPLKDALPERIELAEGDFSVIGKMARLKKLAISAMPVKDFPFWPPVPPWRAWRFRPAAWWTVLSWGTCIV